MGSVDRSAVLAILPKCTGFLSLLGSSYIFADVVRNHKKRAKSVYHRLMMGLSLFDILASAANVLSTWPIPAGTPGVFGAAGTQQTCTAQGFFAEVGNVCTPVYNAALCTYYILIIKNGWPESRIRDIESWLHIVPLFFGWTMGFLGLGFTLYNPSGWLCWFAPYPSNCLVDDILCERGQHSSIFRWLHYAVVWGAILFVTVGMLVIYLSVAKQEKATQHLTRHRRGSVNRNVHTGYGPRSQEQAEGQRGPSKSRKVANQAFLFVLAMYLTWIFTTALRLYQIKNGTSSYPLLLLMAIFFPLQGFFNSLIYLRPRYQRTRLKHPAMPMWQILWVVFLPELAADYLDMSDASMVGARTSQSYSSNPIRVLIKRHSQRGQRPTSSDNDSSTADFTRKRSGKLSSSGPTMNSTRKNVHWNDGNSNPNLSADMPKDDASSDGSSLLKMDDEESVNQSFRSLPEEDKVGQEVALNQTDVLHAVDVQEEVETNVHSQLAGNDDTEFRTVGGHAPASVITGDVDDADTGDEAEVPTTDCEGPDDNIGGDSGSQAAGNQVV